MAFDTVANIVSDAAIELGYVSSAIANPFASTDANVLRLNALLKSLGRDLIKRATWSQLTLPGTVTTANGTASYAVATDFDRIIDGTIWNTTTQNPVVPMSPQAREVFRAGVVTATILQFYRIGGVAVASKQFEIFPTPSAVQTIRYEYVSNYWLQAAASTSAAPGLTAPAAAGDVCWFDPLLLVRGLKMYAQRATGFDSTASQQDFEDTLAQCMGQDQVAPVLSLSGSRGPKMLDGDNVPDTGYGA